MNIRNYLFLQKDKNDCGITCLNMLLAVSLKNRTFLTSTASESAPNFLTMIKIARNYNVTLTGVKIEEEKEVVAIKTPFIIHLKFKGDFAHFVLAQVKHKKIYINDPAHGSYVLTYRQIAPYLTNNYLIVSEVGEYKVKKKKENKKLFLPYLFNALTMVSLLSGIHFLGREEKLIYSYILFTLSFLFYLSERSLLLLALRLFEQKQVSKKVAEIKHSFRTNFEALMKAKTLYFAYPLFRFQLLIHILLLSVIFIFNNSYYLLLIVGLFLLNYASNLYVQKRSSNLFFLNIKLAELETSELSKREEKYNEIIELTNKQASRTVYLQIIMNFITLLSIFSLMIITNTYSLNFLAFHYFGFMYLQEKLKSLFANNEEAAKYHQAARYFS